MQKLTVFIEIFHRPRLDVVREGVSCSHTHGTTEDFVMNQLSDDTVLRAKVERNCLMFDVLAEDALFFGGKLIQMPSPNTDPMVLLIPTTCDCPCCCDNAPEDAGRSQQKSCGELRLEFFTKRNDFDWVRNGGGIKQHHATRNGNWWKILLWLLEPFPNFIKRFNHDRQFEFPQRRNQPTGP